MSTPSQDLASPGVKPYRNAALKATAALVKTGVARVYGWKVQNLDAAIAYVHLYDAAAAADVTVGTTVPKVSIPLIASAVDGAQFDNGVEFLLGIVVAATTTPGGSTAPSTGELVNLFYY